MAVAHMSFRGAAMPTYTELHALSNFSFLRGASHPEELVSHAAQLGYRALALTDECSLAGVVRAHQAAREIGLSLIIGSEFHLSDGLRVVLLAADRSGYANLAGLITRGRRRATKGNYRLHRSDLGDGMPGCLLLWLAGDTPREEHGQWLAARFTHRCWLAVSLLARADDRQRLARLQRLGVRLNRVLPVSLRDGTLLVYMHAQPLVALSALRLSPKCAILFQQRQDSYRGVVLVKQITLRRLVVEHVINRAHHPPQTLHLNPLGGIRYRLDFLWVGFHREGGVGG